MNNPQKRIYDLQEAREKIRAFCVYRDRSQLEVIQKLRGYGLAQSVLDELLIELIQENFLNEQRFAESYVRGKFNQSKWGKYKIRKGLREKGIPESLAEKTLVSQIDPSDYFNLVTHLIEREIKKAKDPKSLKTKEKVFRFLYNRGFEAEVIKDCWPTTS